MKSTKFKVLLLALACLMMIIAGCTTTTTIGNPAPAPAATPAPAAAAAPAAAGTIAHAAAPVPTTTPCPDKEVLTGNWDSREVGYASNHDVNYEGVWADAGPVPVTLTQKCWDVTGTYMVGACPGTLTGKIEKNVFSGRFNLKCENTADSSDGTFSVTMAADNQSFMGSMYRTGGYGPELGFPPSWWAKKTA